MAPKRPREASEPEPASKKPKRGFRVGPDNLPDGPWRRKVTKIKKDLIHKAKVKKAYAKIKAREGQLASAAPATTAADHDAPQDAEGNDSDAASAAADQQMHPTRELMLKDEEKAQAAAHAQADDATNDGKRRRTRRPGYYDKQLQKAEQRRAQADERAREAQQRREQRERRLAERERFKTAMAKTRDRDGRKKLGRESSLLLEKVKKLVGEGQ